MVLPATTRVLQLDPTVIVSCPHCRFLGPHMVGPVTAPAGITVDPDPLGIPPEGCRFYIALSDALARPAQLEPAQLTPE